MLERITIVVLLAVFAACAGCSSKWWPAPGFLDGIDKLLIIPGIDVAWSSNVGRIREHFFEFWN